MKRFTLPEDAIKCECEEQKQIMLYGFCWKRVHEVLGEKVVEIFEPTEIINYRINPDTNPEPLVHGIGTREEYEQPLSARGESERRLRQH